MMHRAAQRLGLCWAEVVLVHVIEACEKCEELGNALLDHKEICITVLKTIRDLRKAKKRNSKKDNKKEVRLRLFLFLQSSTGKAHY